MPYCSLEQSTDWRNSIDIDRHWLILEKVGRVLELISLHTNTYNALLISYLNDIKIKIFLYNFT